MGIETAILGAAAIGGVSSASSASKASSAANNATAAASQASAEQIAFAREQYDDWKATFGDVQDNLSAYYKSLTPDTIQAQGSQAIKQQYTAASQQLTQSLAQRGISGSGLEAQVMTDLATKQAQDQATLRVQAPMMAAQEKMKFLSLGLGQGQLATQGISGALQSQAGLATQQAGMYNQQAAQASQGIGASLSGGINSYLSYNAMQNQNALLSSALSAGSVYPAASLGGTQSINFRP